MTTSSRKTTAQDDFPAVIPAGPEMRIRGWARPYRAIRPNYSKNLRHGTWYPVIRDDLPDRVTIRIGEKNVDVPRRLVEIRTQAPTTFSVVMRISTTTTRSSGTARELGRHYVVCPKCGHRAALMGRPDTKQCPECGHSGEIAWWES